MAHDTHKHPPSAANLPLPPHARGSLLFGNLRDLTRNRLGFGAEMQRRYGEVVSYRLGLIRFTLISHPEHVKHVLQDNHRNYTKGFVLRNLLAPLLGEGLFTAEGEHWLRQRRLMQPVFHHKRIDAFGAIMTAETLKMLDGWGQHAETDRPIDIAGEMMRLTLTIVTRALFGADLGERARQIDHAFSIASEHLTYRFDHPLYPPTAVPTPRNRRFRAALRALDAIVYDLIAERRRTGEDTGDLLSMLIFARDEETGASMSDRQLRDEVMTLLLAGHETTANALTWSWHLLARHAEAEARLHAEVDTLEGCVPTVSDLQRLPYARMVVEEAMRLYPPVWITHRQAIGDDQIGGFRIPAGRIVVVAPWVTHRRPDIWPDPEAFNPERFSPERAAERPRGAYIPFSLGPRQCIGMGFALTEAQLALLTAAQRFRLCQPPRHLVEPEPLLTIRPRGGLPMLVRNR